MLAGVFPSPDTSQGADSLTAHGPRRTIVRAGLSTGGMEWGNETGKFSISTSRTDVERQWRDESRSKKAQMPLHLT